MKELRHFKEGDYVRMVKVVMPSFTFETEYTKKYVDSGFVFRINENLDARYLDDSNGFDSAAYHLFELVIFDPVTNRVPFGLLEPWEQRILQEAEGVPMFWNYRPESWVKMIGDPLWAAGDIFRVIPEPRVNVQDLTGTVKMKDGQPDWSTYEEE